MIQPSFRVFIGYDEREWLGWQVCNASLQATAESPVPVEPIGRKSLMSMGLYTRPQTVRDGVQWDEVSDAPCSTDFSLARFWMARLAGRAGWALYCDCDFLFRRDVREILALRDPRYAVMVVPHKHEPTESSKMDCQVQTVYPRKNWSSLMLINLSHSGAQRLSHHELNTKPGRELHAFCWLKDHEIGFLPEEWNWLDGTSESPDPAAVHFTRGTPDMAGWEDTQYAHEWRRYASIFSRRAA